MKKERVNSWLLLPEELISQIMASSRLDLKSMIKCMGVCKQWRNLISDLISTNPLLTKGHVKFLVKNVRFGALDDKTYQIAWMKTRVIESPDDKTLDDTFGGLPRGTPDRITSSCNGLVCLVGRDDRDIFICNPMTGENIYLTNPGNCIFASWGRRYELGFCPSTNEYKLITFTFSVIEIYTLGSPSGWRSVPCELPEIWTLPSIRAVCVGGVFHWLRKTQNILTYDLAEEVFGSIPLPRLEDGKEIYQLECMDQCLVVTAGYDPPLDLEIWMRKENKSSGESIWTKNWVIDAIDKSLDQEIVLRQINFEYLRPQKLSSDGRIFMTHLGHDLYSYDPRDKLVRHHYYSGTILHAYYTPTLVSPKRLMQKGLKIEKKGD